MQEICLKGSELIIEDNEVTLRAIVTGADSFWFKLDKEYQPLLDLDSVDAFFILYTWLAMEKGLNLRVEGKVSAMLSQSMINTVKDMFLILYPKLNDIKITILKPIGSWSKSNTSPTTATGFSAGVDSWYTAIKAIEENTPYSFYFFVNTGQHGVQDAHSVFKHRANYTKHISRSLKKPLLIINSNIDQIYEARFQQRDVLGNLACVLLLQNVVSSYSYSASYPLSESGIKAHYDMSILDPFLLPALSTERTIFSSIGEEVTRIEKIKYLLSSNEFNKEIYVCTEKHIPVSNCGYCFKCRRTQLALHCIGEYSLLENSFDIDYFLEIKNALLIGLFSNSSETMLDFEVAEQLILKYGHRILHLRVIGFIWMKLKKVLPQWLVWRVKRDAPYLW